MNKELMEALNILEKEKEISKDTLFEAIENSLLTACKNHFGKADNITVQIDRETCDFMVYATKDIVATYDEVEDEVTQICIDDAIQLSKNAVIGDTINIEIKSKEFGRIATQNAKNVILQKIREEERSVVYKQFYEKEKDVVTGIVQRYIGRNISINLGKADAVLNEAEQVKTEEFKPTERIKVYILEVKDTPKGPRILVSRTHPELVKRLFEAEVTEIKDGTVEIMSIAREAGSRTKLAVRTNNPNVDAVGACVGMNGTRVNAIVEELRGEKIDIVNWDENPGNFIQNALSPAKIVAVFADPDEKTAKVVVPDYQLSLAIGKEGQNARLAARLTGYKIDIKSETQAKDAEGFRYEDYLYDEDGDAYYEEEYEYEDGEYDDSEYADSEEGEYDDFGDAVNEISAYEETDSDDVAYEETASEDAAYEETGSEDAAYEETASGDTAYEETAPEDAAYEETASGDTSYEGTENEDSGSGTGELEEAEETEE